MYSRKTQKEDDMIEDMTYANARASRIALLHVWQMAILPNY